MDNLSTYFPELTKEQLDNYQSLYELYVHWNEKINVVSRKDIEALYVKHILHSLGIAKVQSFLPQAQILDVGTGGGFPGIPLAIMFPETNFHLVDSIGKKIKVVKKVSAALQLTNLKATHSRVEVIDEQFDFIVSRAVTRMDVFVDWVKKKVAKKNNHPLKNGILYLKGGDLSEELLGFPKSTVYNLSNYFEEEFFETKKVVHLPLKFKP